MSYCKFCFPFAEEITQFSEQVKMRLISQLINDISRVLQKLVKYFNGSAMLNHKLPAVFEKLSLYSIKLYTDITTSKYFALSIWVLFISLMQWVSGAKFLNITPLFLLCNRFVAWSAPAPVISIVPLASIYASL